MLKLLHNCASLTLMPVTALHAHLEVNARYRLLITTTGLSSLLIKYVCTKKQIMTNNDNLESHLLTSRLLKKTSGLHAGTS